MRKRLDEASQGAYDMAYGNLSSLKLTWDESVKHYEALLQGFEEKAMAGDKAMLAREDAVHISALKYALRAIVSFVF